MIARIGLILWAASVMAGLGYVFYAQEFSGEEAVSANATGGLRTTLRLTPGMNPMRINLRADFRRSGKAAYAVRLRREDGGAVAHEWRGDLDSRATSFLTWLIRRRLSNDYAALPTFAVAEPARFVFEVDVGDDGSGGLQGLHMELRRGVADVRAWPLVLCALMGAAGVVLARIYRKKESP